MLQNLLAAGRRGEAQAALGEVVKLRGNDMVVLEALAFLAFNVGAHGAAREFYHRTTLVSPGDAKCWYNLASSERTLGNLAIAEQACDHALKLDPELIPAALLRSELRKQTPDANHVDELRAWLGRTADGPAAIALNYALGKELDDLGEYDAAFASFARGAAIRRRTLDYDVATDVWKAGRIAETFSAARLADVGPLVEPDYGFIVGMPRSGTTLIERVLTGHHAVTSNGETDNLLKALMAGSPASASDIFARVAAADPALVHGAYARLAGAAGCGRVVLEKLPFNYLYAGAIRLTLPGARIVVLSRAPADNCFAMFSTLFGAGYPFSYALSDLADYYIAYRRLMAHWQQVMPEQLHEVSYEAFVGAPQAIGPAIAAHLGVTWDDAMLKVENNRTTTATASAAQVRKPIYATAKGRWRNYGKHLRPLTDALERAGIDPFGQG